MGIDSLVRSLFILLVFLLLASCKPQKKLATNNEGFVSLFNGENWDGWYHKLRNNDPEMAKRVYAIENGIIHVFKDTPDSLDLNSGENGTHGLFYTKKKFDKFILRFQYKWGTKIANNFDQFQYDAGLYYHVYDDKIWPRGLEYQIRYDHTKNQNHTGDFWATHVRIKWTADENGAYLPIRDGGTVQPPKKSEHRALATARFNALNNQWNDCEVIVMGDRYAIHKLNGEIVNIGTELTHGEGILGFQSETAEIFYRNIEIKELTEEIPIQHFLK
ncbi:3-keto-disaccharide hydrolase [Spongiivirga citrea]|uniref:DUF1080 domain-containing protein n=1 Tax=Spongiivirga citrea TaxID=1481457 RepID=A0A6M0CIP5_9FLAO|nr:DUF1080 domain-containing protein [Spongiivirga citrea]NER17818.1 DUF1080 domain-containing protein [Spongiivirga citrea]